MTYTPTKTPDSKQSAPESIKTFTDHMAECSFIEGTWRDPGIKPYADLQMDPSSTIFHYGQSVFEGMKAYKDREGRLCVFRPLDYLQRLNRSALRLSMPTVPKKLFFSLLEELFLLEEKWLRNDTVAESLYVRPFIIATDTSLAASPSDTYKFFIICSPLISEDKNELRVKVVENFSRAAPGGVGSTTSGGNYAAEFHPLHLAEREGFQQLLWTDAETNSFLEQVGNMNLFLRIGSSLVTPPVNDRVFDGITRKSILRLAEQEGIPVEVREISVNELVEAAKSSELREVFGTDSLNGITSIRSFSFQGCEYILPRVERSYGSILHKKLVEVQYNPKEDTIGWRYRISGA